VLTQYAEGVAHAADHAIDLLCVHSHPTWKPHQPAADIVSVAKVGVGSAVATPSLRRMQWEVVKDRGDANGA
jgi:hypothetical protein